MTRPQKPVEKPFDDESQLLGRHLYDQSAVFTRAAHAFEAAADQVRQAHCSDYEKAANEARSASMVAMHAALSAYQLVGTYELAAWIEKARDNAKE